MKNINFYSQGLNFALASSLFIIPSPQLLAIENAPNGGSIQNSLIAQNQTGQGKVIFARPPRGQGTPGRTVPAGSRGCPQVSQNPFHAIVPVTKEPDGTELRWGLTTQTHPTVWYYVPYESTSIKSARLFLYDRSDRKLYETSVTLPGVPGLVSIPLPAAAPSLEQNQWYRLDVVLDITCSTTANLKRDVAQLWVRREPLTPALIKELEGATTLEKAILYAKNGIWFEALTAVAELRRSNPQDPQWNYLLQSADLRDTSRP